ncbi:unnamed protein product [Amoebophrya sp. A25]|nr:unnamed protein product [Amoebophrya sp. A25]|eukprot:GSA25T00022920001.1
MEQSSANGPFAASGQWVQEDATVSPPGNASGEQSAATAASTTSGVDVVQSDAGAVQGQLPPQLHLFPPSANWAPLLGGPVMPMHPHMLHPGGFAADPNAAYYMHQMGAVPQLGVGTMGGVPTFDPYSGAWYHQPIMAAPGMAYGGAQFAAPNPMALMEHMAMQDYNAKLMEAQRTILMGEHVKAMEMMAQQQNLIAHAQGGATASANGAASSSSTGLGQAQQGVSSPGGRQSRQFGCSPDSPTSRGKGKGRKRAGKRERAEAKQLEQEQKLLQQAAEDEKRKNATAPDQDSSLVVLSPAPGHDSPKKLEQSSPEGSPGEKSPDALPRLLDMWKVNSLSEVKTPMDEVSSQMTKLQGTGINILGTTGGAGAGAVLLDQVGSSVADLERHQGQHDQLQGSSRSTNKDKVVKNNMDLIKERIKIGGEEDSGVVLEDDPEDDPAGGDVEDDNEERTMKKNMCRLQCGACKTCRRSRTMRFEEYTVERKKRRNRLRSSSSSSASSSASASSSSSSSGNNKKKNRGAAGGDVGILGSRGDSSSTSGAAALQQGENANNNEQESLAFSRGIKSSNYNDSTSPSNKNYISLQQRHFSSTLNNTTTFLSAQLKKRSEGEGVEQNQKHQEEKINLTEAPGLALLQPGQNTGPLSRSSTSTSEAALNNDLLSGDLTSVTGSSACGDSDAGVGSCSRVQLGVGGASGVENGTADPLTRTEDDDDFYGPVASMLLMHRAPGESSRKGTKNVYNLQQNYTHNNNNLTSAPGELFLYTTNSQRDEDQVTAMSTSTTKTLTTPINHLVQQPGATTWSKKSEQLAVETSEEAHQEEVIEQTSDQDPSPEATSSTSTQAASHMVAATLLQEQVQEQSDDIDVLAAGLQQVPEQDEMESTPGSMDACAASGSSKSGLSATGSSGGTMNTSRGSSIFDGAGGLSSTVSSSGDSSGHRWGGSAFSAVRSPARLSSSAASSGGDMSCQEREEANATLETRLAKVFATVVPQQSPTTEVEASCFATTEVEASFAAKANFAPSSLSTSASSSSGSSASSSFASSASSSSGSSSSSSSTSLRQYAQDSPSAQKQKQFPSPTKKEKDSINSNKKLATKAVPVTTTTTSGSSASESDAEKRAGEDLSLSASDVAKRLDLSGKVVCKHCGEILDSVSMWHFNSKRCRDRQLQNRIAAQMRAMYQAERVEKQNKVARGPPGLGAVTGPLFQ